MTSKSACYRQNTLPTENTEKNDEYQQKKRAHIIKKTAQTSGYMDCRKKKDKKYTGRPRHNIARVQQLQSPERGCDLHKDMNQISFDINANHFVVQMIQMKIFLHPFWL